MNNTQYSNTLPLCHFVMLNGTILNVAFIYCYATVAFYELKCQYDAECRYAECRYSECRGGASDT